MPYRSKYKNKNKNKAKPVSALALAKRNARILRERKPEVKFHDVLSTATMAAAGSSTIVAMCSIPQGSTAQSRVGADITLKSLNIRGYFQKAAPATGATFVRMLLVQSMTDESPVSSTVFNNTPYPTSFRNMNHTSDFRVIYDKIYTLNQDSDVGRYFHININKFPSKLIQWDQADTSGSSSKKGKLYAFFTTEEATYPPSYTMTARIRYIDC